MFVGRVCRADVTVFLRPLSTCSLRVLVISPLPVR